MAGWHLHTTMETTRSRLKPCVDVTRRHWQVGAVTSTYCSPRGRFGPLEAVPTPGHASDHFALVGAGACFTGDAVLGEGSVFISPHAGAMAGYLRALEALRERSDFDVICPGHGPPVWDVRDRLTSYLDHRLDREHALIGALAQGHRSVVELLDAAWSDVPSALRPAAAVTLAAHLDKLEEEGRLPAGVERPAFGAIAW